jgi:hypothetical protein
MMAVTLRKRVERLEGPAGGDFDHLTDAELDELIAAVWRGLLTDIGDGDPARAYAEFAAQVGTDIPGNWQELAGSFHHPAHAGLLAFVQERIPSDAEFTRKTARHI